MSAVRRTVPLSSDCGCSARADRTRQLCERDRNGAGTCSSLPRLSLGIPSTASLQSAGASAFAASPSRSTRRPAAASSSSTSLGPWRSSNATSSGSAPRQGSPQHGHGADRAADPRRWMNARRRLPGCSTPTRTTRSSTFCRTLHISRATLYRYIKPGPDGGRPGASAPGSAPTDQE